MRCFEPLKDEGEDEVDKAHEAAARLVRCPARPTLETPFKDALHRRQHIFGQELCAQFRAAPTQRNQQIDDLEWEGMPITFSVYTLSLAQNKNSQKSRWQKQPPLWCV